MAAYSKAEKLRVKRGRPSLPAVAREANGRKSRRKTTVALRLVETEKEVKSVAVANRMKMGLSAKVASTQEAGSVLGRLHLLNPDEITRAQFEAGMRMAEDYARYYALTGIPFPSVKAMDIARVRGLGNMDRPDAARIATNRVMKIETVLGLVDLAGKPVTSVTKKVCVLDEGEGMQMPHMIGYLKRGLLALVEHYEIYP
ncbi:hypothetical protein [Pseudochrobactrum asaccharolyticum]|uniref:hypothetical protein n=1 Tax=Pseudochrobactrum asaccharolyticum TaxID=354351 RepID=UPI0040421C89